MPGPKPKEKAGNVPVIRPTCITAATPIRATTVTRIPIQFRDELETAFAVKVVQR